MIASPVRELKGNAGYLSISCQLHFVYSYGSSNTLKGKNIMTIFGQPGEELGDTLVFESLKCLSRDWIVYAQPQFVGSEGDRHPDYIIIHPNVGVIILEVKDWQQIE
jgi:hypothetical protein